MNAVTPLSAMPISAQAALTAKLREEVAHKFGSSKQNKTANSSGFAALDQILPQAGFENGVLVEWLYHVRGNGAGTLALLSAASAVSHPTNLLVVDFQRQFYPPAAAALGIDLNQVVLIRPTTEHDAFWACEQALRSPAVAAVWGHLPNMSARTFRRLQLAAEAGQTMGHLVRPLPVRKQPSWAQIQLVVEAGENARQRVTVARARQGNAGQQVELQYGA